MKMEKEKDSGTLLGPTNVWLNQREHTHTGRVLNIT